MAINTAEILNVYDSMIDKMVNKYDEMYNSDKIDAETYAKLVGNANLELIKLSMDLVQKQQQIESELLTAEKQRAKIDEDIETANKQQLILDQEKLAKEYEVTHLLPAQASKLNKEVITERNRGAEIADATVRANTELNDKLLVTAKQRNQIDKQISKLDKDIDDIEKNIEVKNNSIEIAQTELSIKKEVEAINMKVKEAQKIKVMREAIIDEQRQQYLKAQTDYETARKDLLSLNTKANMLIRMINDSVNEISVYLSNSTDLPSGLAKVVANAKLDLAKLTDAVNTDGDRYNQTVA